MTSGQYSFCLLLNADWLIQISAPLCCCTQLWLSIDVWRSLKQSISLFSYAQTIASQCPTANTQSNLFWIRCIFTINPGHTIGIPPYHISTYPTSRSNNVGLPWTEISISPRLIFVQSVFWWVYLEGLIIGILRYVVQLVIFKKVTP